MTILFDRTHVMPMQPPTGVAFLALAYLLYLAPSKCPYLLATLYDPFQHAGMVELAVTLVVWQIFRFAKMDECGVWLGWVIWSNGS